MAEPFVSVDSLAARESRATRNWLLAILVVAFCLRAGAAVGLQWLLEHRLHRPFLIQGDADGYWQLACKLARGEDYAVHQPPRLVHRMPGLPAILAVTIAVFGENFIAARLMLAAVGTLGVWLTFHAGRAFGTARTGLIAAALAAISPTFVLFSVMVLTEVPFAVALVLNVVVAQALFQSLTNSTRRPSRSFWLAVATGVAVALGVMMRPSWLLAAPVQSVLITVLAPLAVQRMLRKNVLFRSALAGVVLTAAMVLALLPWGLRNQNVSGHFTLTTFWMGPSLYDGLRPGATGESDMRFYDEDRLFDRMSEFEVDQEYRRRAWAFACGNPNETARLAVVKAARYWAIWPNAAQFSQWWLRWGAGLWTIFLTVPLAMGLLSMTASRAADACPHSDSLSKTVLAGTSVQRIWALAVLAGPVVYFALIHLLFVSSLRYRLPAEMPLLVIAAWGWQWMVSRPAAK